MGYYAVPSPLDINFSATVLEILDIFQKTTHYDQTVHTELIEFRVEVLFDFGLYYTGLIL